MIGAANCGLPEMCRLLLDNKADINDNIDKYEPYSWALDCRPGIIEEIEHRRKKVIFDSFVTYHIEFPLYKNRIYSICYQGNIQVAEPTVGWPRAKAVLNKYFFDETFFYLHLHVAKIVTNSESHYSSITALAVNDDTSTLMTVLVDRLKLYLEPVDF